MSDEWWREQIPDGEKILWVGQPDQGFFPPRYGWAYKAILLLLIGIWAGSPWMIETVREFWEIFFCTIGFAFVIYADRFVRAQRMYAVTSHSAWKLNRELKSKSLKIDNFLTFRTGRRAILFDRHPFFAFEHLSDPDTVLKALTQAREAQT